MIMTMETDKMYNEKFTATLFNNKLKTINTD